MRLLAWLSCQSPIKCKFSLKVKYIHGCSLRRVQAWKRVMFGQEQCAMDPMSCSPGCILLRSALQTSPISFVKRCRASSILAGCSNPPTAAQHAHAWVPSPGIISWSQEMSLISTRRKINVLRSARVLFVEGICASERAVDFQETEAFKCLNHCWKYACKFF